MAAGLWLVNVDQLKQFLPFLKDIGVALLANLTFKFLPVVGSNVLAVLFDMFLRPKPVLKALKMDVAH